ncbi:MAG: hypothetical protein ABI740_06125 [Alphaproteobacteria bacterium]
MAAMNSNPPTRIKWDPDCIRTLENPEADLSTAMLLNVGRGAWDSFVMVFGDVADLAAGDRIERRKAKMLQTWIAALEKIVRCLLLMMAFELALPRSPGPAPTPPVLQTRSAKPDNRDDDGDDADDAPSDAPIDLDAWRVSLPMLYVRHDFIDVADDWTWVEPTPALRDSRVRDGLFGTSNVAQRAEAVLRILNDPGPYAQRLALRLSKLWAPLEFPPPPRVRYLKPISIDHDPEPAPPPRPGPYDRWLKPARKRCEEMAAAYWSDG